MANVSEHTFKEDHWLSSYCQCLSCRRMRTTYNCSNPTKCATMAKNIMLCLQPKWLPSENPNVAPQQGGESAPDDQEDDSTCTFNPKILLTLCIEDAFHVIRPKTERHPHPATPNTQSVNPPHTPEGMNIVCSATSQISDDGEYILSGSTWFGTDNSHNMSFQSMPTEYTSRDTGVLGALIQTIHNTNPLDDLTINMSDRNIMQNLTVKLGINEGLDWFHLQDSDLYRALTANLKSRAGSTTFKLWRKSTKPDSASNAESLTKSALTSPQQQAVDMDIQLSFLIQGQCLLARSQWSFYQNLMTHHNGKHYSPRTATKELWGMTPSPQQLWRSIRSRDIPKNIRNFLWKCLHGSYKIGSYWRNIPNYEDWGICHLCGETKLMEHILVDCEPSTIQKTVWELASKLCCKREDAWPNVSFGSILGVNLPNSANTKSTKKKGRNRLFTILVLESAHLIWKLRCQWIIENKGNLTKLPTREEIHNRWVKNMNLRLKFDKLQTDTKRYGSRAMKSDLVLKTWSGILLDEDNLPDNWIWESGVLVGITLPRPLGHVR